MAMMLLRTDRKQAHLHVGSLALSFWFPFFIWQQLHYHQAKASQAISAGWRGAAQSLKPMCRKLGEGQPLGKPGQAAPGSYLDNASGLLPAVEKSSALSDHFSCEAQRAARGETAHRGGQNCEGETVRDRVRSE